MTLFSILFEAEQKAVFLPLHSFTVDTKILRHIHSFKIEVLKFPQSIYS